MRDNAGLRIAVLFLLACSVTSAAMMPTPVPTDAWSSSERKMAFVEPTQIPWLAPTRTQP